MRLYKGWQVAFAGTGVNLLVGVVYAWSIFAAGLTEELGWSQAQAALPYTVCIFCFAGGMIVAGGIHDRVGPRPMIRIGALLTGGSFMVSSFFMSPVVVAVVWGVMYGTGLACCFSSATPAAMKWFPPEKRGLVAGVVVTGTGLSALVAAPLLHVAVSKGIALSFFITGAVLFVGLAILSQLVYNPPFSSKEEGGVKADWYQVLKTRRFYLLWIMFCLTAASGLTFTAHMDRIARVQASFGGGFMMVSLFAFFNAVGRPAGGFLSDLLGRRRAMTVNFIVMTLVLLFTVTAVTPLSLAAAASLLGLVYGALYSLFPAVTAAYFGEKGFGLNYGFVFSAIGLAALFPLLAGYLYDRYENFTVSFILLSIFSAAAVMLTLLMEDNKS